MLDKMKGLVFQKIKNCVVEKFMVYYCIKVSINYIYCITLTLNIQIVQACSLWRLLSRISERCTHLTIKIRNKILGVLLQNLLVHSAKHLLLISGFLITALMFSIKILKRYNFWTKPKFVKFYWERSDLENLFFNYS